MYYPPPRAILSSLLLLGMGLPILLADVAPPVVVRLQPTTSHAVAGEIFEGVFEVELTHPGLLQKFAVVGEGWTFLEADLPEEGFFVEPTTISIHFKAIPTDPESRIGLSLAYECAPMTRTFAVGAEALARRGQPSLLMSRSTGSSTTIVPGADSDRPSRTNGAGNIRVTGRIMYDRIGKDGNDDGDFVDPEDIPPMTLGVDEIYLRLIDVDSFGSETIWSGKSGPYGHFDSGDVFWDDCALDGCDDPDLMLEVFTSSDVAQITEDGSPFTIYYWTTPEIVDFTGSFHDYGELAPANPDTHPALHIWNSIIRTNRFTVDIGGHVTELVNVLWPELDPSGAPAYYDRSTATIHIKPGTTWSERTHAHEYGHHFVISRSVPPVSDYCNGYCDGETLDGDTCQFDLLCANPGHCNGCPENVTDAWNEGWPDWLADVVTRWMGTAFLYDDNSFYEPLFPRSDESLPVCCETGMIHAGEADKDEGHVAALLRDIEDYNFDYHPETASEHRIDRDMLCLGVSEIFDVQVAFSPTTVEEFLFGFLGFYPEHAAALRHTAWNISPIYVGLSNFPDDTQTMGPVVSAQSPSHPSGQGGYLPCVTVAWDPPVDDSNGACAYSYQLDPSPSVTLDEVEMDVDSIDCQLATTVIAESLGPQYFSIMAHECGRPWTDTAVFGPFEILDCNNSGIIDLCDISCDHTGLAGVCEVPDTLCQGAPNCGQSSDCQIPPNLIPDECDIASGFSEDCNENGIPDECEVMKHWGGGTGDWNSDFRWVEGVRPVSGDFVCIEDPAQASTVTYRSGDIVVPILASDESVEIANNFQVYAKLTLSEPSWIRGDLILRNDLSRLTVNDRLDIDGSLIWSNSAKLGGSGTTYVGGGLNNPSGIAVLDNHSLVLLAGTTSVVTGRIDGNGSSTLQIRPTASIEFQGTQHLMNYGVMNVEGSLLKTGDWSSSTGAMVYNDGLVHVQDGAFQFTGGGQVTGTLLGDTGTTITVSAHDFLAGSTIQADRLAFVNGCCTGSDIRGSYDVTTRTSNAVNSTVTFHPSATIVNYGTEMILTSGKTYFNAVTGGTVFFDTFTAGGQVYLNSGDPIVTQNLTLALGFVQGPSELTANGTFIWPGGSSINGPGVVNSNGTLQFTPGSSVRGLNNRTLNHAGTANFNGSLSLTSAAVINNLPSGVINLPIDGLLLYGTSPKLNNAGAIVKSGGGGISTIQLDVTNTGLIESEIGTLTIHKLNQTAGEILLDGGNFAMTSPNPLNLAGGALRGNGMVTGVVNNSGGSVEPGLSAGTLTLVNNYNQSAPARLVSQLGGPLPGTGYDQLILTGSATASLAGTLRVELIDGYVPDVGSLFDVVVASNVTGNFDTIESVGFPADRAVRIVDLSGGVKLQVYHPNCDGEVAALGSCPAAICPLIDYSLGNEPVLTFGDPADCPVGTSLPGGVDFVEGALSALSIEMGNVGLGFTVPVNCGGILDSFLWDSPPPATGESRFFLVRAQGDGNYGQATSGESRQAGYGDCP